jgi:alpha-aminoadipic semialdehyde synthase
VKQLVQRGIKVIVQPSSLRTFADKSYAEVTIRVSVLRTCNCYQAGALLQDDLSECSAIVAVKEIPIDLLQPNTTYMFFSHTIKAQPINMKMLDTILERVILLASTHRLMFA